MPAYIFKDRTYCEGCIVGATGFVPDYHLGDCPWAALDADLALKLLTWLRLRPADEFPLKIPTGIQDELCANCGDGL